MYRSLTNVIEAERIAIASGNANMEAVAIVLRSWIFSILTDAYGDVPYSEAINGVDSNNYMPVYDEQEEIYLGSKGLLAELDRANLLLDASDPITGDILYDGNSMKWKKLCNSLSLRLLMRVSNKIDVANAMQSIVTKGDIMSSNDDNAFLHYLESFPNEFPIVPLKTGDFDAVVISQQLVNTMDLYNDPRLAVYARPDNLDFNNPTFHGAINGSENPDVCDKSGSRLGLIYYDYPEHPTLIDHADGILLMYSEVEFLLAEASSKGYIDGDAAEHYKEGIRASMDYYAVDYDVFGYSDFEDYYGQSGVSYDSPIDIWEQKWLSLFFTSMEPYFEVRRWLSEVDFDWEVFDFLEPTCENVNNDKLPLRFLYPGEEQSLNTANYQAAISILGGNSQNAEMWLLQ
jgi:hypothetical protein